MADDDTSTPPWQLNWGQADSPIMPPNVKPWEHYRVYGQGGQLEPAQPVDQSVGGALKGIGMELGKGFTGATGEPAFAAISAAFPGAEDGGTSFSERYQRNLAANRQQTGALEAAHPWQTTGVQAAGNLAGTAVGAARFPAAFGVSDLNVGNLGISGLAQGALAGLDAFGRGKDVPVNSVIGAGIGVGAPLVAGGAAGKVTGLAADWLTPKLNTPSVLSGIDTRALEWASNAARADGLTADNIAERINKMGPDAFIAEYGANTRGAAQGVSSMPGEGKQTVFEALNARAAGTRQRIEEATTTAFGPRRNIAELEAQREQQRKAVADPLYSAWRATPVPMTPELEALKPRLQAAGVYGTAFNKMNIQGEPAAQTYFKMDAQGNPTLDTASQPTAQVWDYLKRGLDDKISTAQRAGNRDDARIYTSLKSDLVRAIDEHPDERVAGVWRQARQAYAGPAAIQSAQEAGQGVFDRPVRVDQLAQELKDMSMPERAAFVQGARDQVAGLMDATSRGDTRARELFRAPTVQEKAALLVGPERTQQLVARMEQERNYAETHSAVLQNSETAARLAAQQTMTADPSTTFASRIRHAYSPHVTPGLLVPMGRSLEKGSAEAQAESFAQSRAQLAPILMEPASSERGQQLAKALVEYQPPREVAAPIASYGASFGANQMGTLFRRLLGY